MRVISKKPFRDFWLHHHESKSMLEEWFRRATHCKAVSCSALRQTFGTADYVDGFTGFDVGGNRYRIAAVVHCDKRRIYVRQVMTHAEYDRNDWRKK